MRTGSPGWKGEAAFAAASGMAAVNGALISMLKAGDHVVSARALFGSCLYILEDILPRFGVEVSFVDGTDLDAWRAALRPGTAAVFLESVSNPVLEVIDIETVATLAHEVGASVVVDKSLPPRSFRGPSILAPMLWSIRPPNISTVRAGFWAV